MLLGYVGPGNIAGAETTLIAQLLQARASVCVSFDGRSDVALGPLLVLAVKVLLGAGAVGFRQKGEAD